MHDGLFIIRFPGKGHGSSRKHCPARYLILAFVNLKKKEVQVKVVYYGPGRGGKTTNLEYIYKRFNQRIKTEMVTIKTHGDRTLFFDFLPFDIGKIKGYDVKIQLYTVPGQVKYDSTRRLVLRGVDAIVFGFACQYSFVCLCACSLVSFH